MHIRQDDRLFEYFMSASKDLIFVKDCEHRYIKVNGVFLDMLNKTFEEVLGRTDLELFPEHVAQWHIELDRIVFKEDRIVENYEWTTDSKGERHYLEIIKFPLYDEQGALIGLMGQSRDMTQRKLIEDRLKERDHYLNGLIEGMEQGLAVHEMIYDEQGIPCDYRFLEVNPQFERMTGLNRADLIGRTVLEVLPETEPYWIETYGKVVLTGQSIRYENASNTIGKVFAVYAFKSKENQFAVLIEDVTQRKAYEDELIQERLKAERANLAKDQFLANMSHEIRTPVNGIIGLVDLVRTTKLTDDQKLYTDMIKKSSLALVDIIEDILEYVGLTNAEGDSLVSPFCIAHLLEEINGLYAFSMKQKGLNFKINQDEACKQWFLGDPLKVKQILMSLLGNALKFTSSGEVLLSACCHSITDSEADIEFEVKDTGIGISQTAQESIFRIFEQGDSTIKKHYKGLGLGLSRVSEICRTLGAEVNVVSQTDVGSSFKVRLRMPLLSESIQPPSDLISDKENESFLERRQRTILLVEEDAVSRVVMELMLKSMDYKVISVENGQSAIRQLERSPVDLIIMELHLPDLDGFEVAKSIRNELKTEWKTIPIVAVTSHASEANFVKGIETGINDFLSKPVDKTQLINLIERWIDNV